MTLALTGLAIYLFCIHSFKLPIASVGIALGLLGVLIEPKGIKLPAPLAFMCAWLIWSLATGMQSQYPEMVTDAFVDFLKILLVFFVAINAAKGVSQIGLVCGIWVLMFDLYPARGSFFNYVFGIGTFERFGWNFSFSNFNDLAAYGILALALAAFLATGPYSKLVRFGALLSTGAIAVLILLTQSRGAFVGLVIAFFFLALRSNNRKILVRSALVATALFAFTAPASTWQRFANMKFLADTETIKEADSSAEQRWIVLQIASAIVRDHPLTGVGLGAYSEAHGVYAADRQEWAFGAGNRDTHNMYMNLVAETGFPGALLFLLMIASVIRRATHAEKKIRARDARAAEQLRILRFGLIAYLIAAVFGTFHKVAFLYLYMAVLWQAAELLVSQSTQVVNSTLRQASAASGARRIRGLIFRGPRIRADVIGKRVAASISHDHTSPPA